MCDISSNLTTGSMKLVFLCYIGNIGGNISRILGFINTIPGHNVTEDYAGPASSNYLCGCEYAKAEMG